MLVTVTEEDEAWEVGAAVEEPEPVVEACGVQFGRVNVPL